MTAPPHPLFNDTLTTPAVQPASNSSSPARFTLFPHLPAELRIKIWQACLPTGRMISLGLAEEPFGSMREDIDDPPSAAQDYYKTTNPLGHIISSFPYQIRVKPFPQWSRVLQSVNREANDTYCSFYRLRIPLLSAPWLLHTSQLARDKNTWASGVARPLQSEREARLLIDGRLRLSPETDIVEVHFNEAVLWNVKSRRRRRRLQYGEKQELIDRARGSMLAAVLFDACAYDPLGKGIVRLALGRFLYFTSRDSSVAEALRTGVSSAISEHGDAVRDVFREYFEGFGLKDGKRGMIRSNNVLYATSPVDMQARYRSPSTMDMVDVSLNPLVRRAVPVMPQGWLTQTVAITDIFEVDPRLVTVQGTPAIRNVRFKRNSSNDPRRLIADWESLLAMFDVQADREDKVRWLVAVWADKVYDKIHTRQQMLAVLANSDRNHLDGLLGEMDSGLGYHARLRMEQRRRQLGATTEVPGASEFLASLDSMPDVAGAWVFSADAIGELYVSDSDTDSDGPGNKPESVSFDLSVNTPGLIVFEWE